MLEIIWFLSILFAIHYVADFFIQVYTWKKSSQLVRNLIIHTIAYLFVITFGLIVLGAVFPNQHITHVNMLGFLGVNAVAHFITDFIVKKVSKVLHHYNEITAFVNIVALDQCIHYITLMLTFGWFFL